MKGGAAVVKWHSSAMIVSVIFSGILVVIPNSRAAAQQKVTPPDNQSRSRAVVAVVNGKHTVTAADVDSLFPADVRSAGERLEVLRASGLETLVTKAVLSQEAEKRGLSLDAFLWSLVPKAVDIDPLDIEREYLESGRSLGIIDEAQARALLRIQMEAQRRIAAFRSAVAGLRKEARIELNLTDQFQQAVGISERGHSLGQMQAAAVLVIFTDLECPYCRRAHETIHRIAKEFEGNLRITYRHLPLSIHRTAFAAAIASECASRQASFWPYVDRIFAAAELSDSFLRTAAEKVGLEMTAFDLCLKSSEAVAEVLADMREARQAAIDATPWMVLNGRTLRSPSYESLKEEIEREISSKRTGSRTTRDANGGEVK